MKKSYPFFTPTYDRAGKHAQKYPLASRIFDYPIAYWYGRHKGKKPLSDITKRVNRLMKRAHPDLPIIVIYNLPDRDIGKHSQGGTPDTESYYHFIEDLALGIGTAEPVIIYEPDALAHSTMMSPEQQSQRLETMRGALVLLEELCNATIYVDVGHSDWLPPREAAALLNQVATPGVRGFSVNVSNYRTTSESMMWARQVSEHTPHKHFVIDTSRNGSGPWGSEWCNPPGRSLGTPATTDTGDDLCDAYLWIKVPGESDGTCNGGPKAGNFWPQHASELVQNTPWLN